MNYDPTMLAREATESVGAIAHALALGFQVAAVATITAVSIGALVWLFRNIRREPDWTTALLSFRTMIGRGILLGLELLVAADIIGTIAVTPTFRSLGILALIIAIRTFLSASLTVEMEGTLPWRRAKP